jgi:hypothetical protein
VPSLTPSLRDRLARNPAYLLALIAILTSFLVQSGELGSSDTQHRLQTTHSFWTHEPPVFHDEYPEFGIHGRHGKLYAWYGIGQSLVMLPSDVLGTAIQKLPLFADYRGDQADPTVRNIVVTYTTNTLVCVLAVLVAFRFLLLLGFATNQSLAGALALLFGTTFLHYTQNMMENNLLFLLTLTGLCFQFAWTRTGSRRALLLGSLALGANLTIRLTTALDIAAAGLFVLLVLSLENSSPENYENEEGNRDGSPGVSLLQKLAAYALIAAPCYSAGFLVDRLYHFARFGSWTSTYISLFALERRQRDPSLSPNFPWTTPWRAGILGPLFSPEKSIFLFDPLLVLSLLLAVCFWKKLAPQVKAFLITAYALVAAYILFYARYYSWAGNFAWGDRYVSTAVQLAAFISVPLLLRYCRPRIASGRDDAADAREVVHDASAHSEFVQAQPLRNKSQDNEGMLRVLWTIGWALVCASVVVQIASVMFWCPLELYQLDISGRTGFVIWWRLKNIAAFALGKTEAWGLLSSDSIDDMWDYQHITTWNFLPFVLRRVGEAPSWLVHAAMAAWFTLLACLASILAFLAKLRRESSPAEKKRLICWSCF